MSKRKRIILPQGTNIGYLGTGQLGRMEGQALSRMGYGTDVFGPEGGAHDLATVKTVCKYNNIVERYALVERMKSSVVTIETESLPPDLITWMAERVRLVPGPLVIETASHRRKEKECATKLGIKTAPYVLIDAEHSCPADFTFPGFLKTCTDGLDGRMMELCNSVEDVERWLNDKKFAGKECILEEKLNFECEVSIAVSRDCTGKIVFYPPMENTQENGILIHSIYHAKSIFHSAQLRKQIEEIARAIAEELELEGILVIEMFFMGGNKGFVFNEMAPRVHNSYHGTDVGFNVSQFEMKARILVGAPIYTPEPLFPMIRMENILYEYSQQDWNEWFSNPNIFVTLYNKKPNGRKENGVVPRKIGHRTYLYTNVG